MSGSGSFRTTRHEAEEPSTSVPRWAASFMRRRSVGSESSVERSQRFSSSADIVAILELNSSRTALTISTVSNVLAETLLIGEHLSGRPDLDCRISELRVHSMIPTNPRQVHHMPEVPAYERIHLGDGRHRNMLGVSQHVRGEDTLGEITAGQLARCRSQPNDLDMGVRNCRQHCAYRRRGERQLPESQL